MTRLPRLLRWVVAGLIASLGVGWFVVQDARVAPMATFNIENFPREATQPQAAAEAIAALGVPVVALQEIRSPERLLRAVHDRMGASWAYVTHTGATHRVGLLVDERRYLITGVRVHDDVRVVRGGRPALEVTLRPRFGWTTQTVFVVHLKSGPSSEDVRRAQLQALAKIVGKSAAPVTVLGDFNPVTARDRRDLDRFASSAGLWWATAHLGCTAYFPDGARCRGVALDHVVTSARWGRAKAVGACATEGCDPGQSCPRWVRQVSDHCPVVFVQSRSSSSSSQGGMTSTTTSSTPSRSGDRTSSTSSK